MSFEAREGGLCCQLFLRQRAGDPGAGEIVVGFLRQQAQQFVDRFIVYKSHDEM
jgi:hypothetical protein